MRNFAIIISIIIAFVLGTIYGVRALFDFPSVSYRYRLTIAVEVDGQVHSESSVIEVKTVFFPSWASGMANGSQLHSTDEGQAVFIDLGTRGALVSALRWNNGGVDARELPGRAFKPSLMQRNASGIPATPENERAIAKMEGRVELAPDNMPAFFWFSDPTNLATAKLVKPANFAAEIGDSAHLVSATVEITHDPIVIDIDQKLPIYTAPSGSAIGPGIFINSRSQ
jgi:hypothetical protein